MSTVSRNPTVRFSRIADHEDADDRETQQFSPYGGETERIHGWRVFSARRSNQNLMSSWSYRRDRARKRRIYLQTYKLGAISSGEKILRSRKLKKMAVKVKSAVVSVLAFVRGGALRSCRSPSAIRTSSPSRAVKFC